MHNRYVSYPNLQINGNKIEHVTEFNFLGLALQSNLSWNKHINHHSLWFQNQSELYIDYNMCIHFFDTLQYSSTSTL